MKKQYDKEYFDFQKGIGILSAKVNTFLFKPYIKENYNVVDFGCGGGYLLATLECQSRKGVEINEAARLEAQRNGIDTVNDASVIPDEWADVIISSHALEHCHDPLGELKTLYSKLKQDGRIVFIVPHEKKGAYRSSDVNQHLFTWSGMNLGNLFTVAGYKVVEVKEIKHKFPPHGEIVYSKCGLKVFHFLATVYGSVARGNTQVRIVAKKES